MQFKKPKHILERTIALHPDRVAELQELAASKNSEFWVSTKEAHPPQATCGFTVEGKRGPADIERKKNALIKTLQEAQVGDERGVFNDLLYLCTMHIHRLAEDDFRESISNANQHGRKRFGMAAISCVNKEGENGLRLYHEDNRHDAILICFDEDKHANVRIECETERDLSLLVSYISGALVRHFWHSVESIDVELKQLKTY